MNPALIASLVQLGLQVFGEVLALIQQKGMPVSATSSLITHLNSTPGMTEDHKTVVASAVNTAVQVAGTMAK